MSRDTSLIAPHLETFFADHLCNHKRVSQQTIASCRDTFRLLLTYLRDTQKIQPSRLKLTELDAPVVLSFLQYLESERGNSVRSRNLRLSAIRSFYRWVALREPEYIGIVTRIMAIPSKREDKKLIGYLTRPEIDAIINAPEKTTWAGRRDRAMLLTLYNSGARVTEIATLERSQVYFGLETYLQLNGKGRKERTVPLWPETVTALKSWFRELADLESPAAFPSARLRLISRHGINHILQGAVEKASEKCHSLREKSITPHIVRHTTAVHLLQSGVDVAVIALWLGHENIETTHVYLATDLEAKEKALSKLKPGVGPTARYKADDALLTFLKAL